MKFYQRVVPPPIIVLIVGILAVSTASIFIRFAQTEAPSLVIAAYRMTLSAIFLAPFAISSITKSLRELTNQQKLLVLLSGIFLAFHFAAWITSLEYTSVTSSVVLVTTTPLWVAIFSPLVLKERLGKEVWFGLVLAMVGGFVVAIQDACSWQSGQVICLPLEEFVGGRALFGNGLALLGAFMAAGYMIVGRQIRPVLSLFSYTFWVYSISAMILIGIVGLSKQPFTGFSPPMYLWLSLLAIFPQVIGHSSFNWALKYLPAAFVSLALLGEPVGTTILAVIFLKEIPGWIEILGGVMILTGIFLASRSGLTTNPQD